MLDSTSLTIRTGPTYPQTVTQKLAPTAEHMRLLREYEEAALASVVQRTRVDSNCVLGEVVMLARQVEQDRLVVVRVVVNGREVQVSAPMPIKDALLSPEECLRRVREVLAAAIVEELV